MCVRACVRTCVCACVCVCVCVCVRVHMSLPCGNLTLGLRHAACGCTHGCACVERMMKISWPKKKSGTATKLQSGSKKICFSFFHTLYCVWSWHRHTDTQDAGNWDCTFSCKMRDKGKTKV